MEVVKCNEGHTCLWSEYYQSHWCDRCKGCVMVCTPYEGLQSLYDAMDAPPEAHTPRTFQVTSGPVTWTMEVVAHSTSKRWKVRDVDTGLIYWLDVFLRVLKGCREGRRGKLWTWDVSTLDGRKHWDWRHPIPRLES